MTPIISARPRVVIAPDKFKGSLTATEAALAISAGVQAYWPTAEITLLPLADGGEGTIDSALAAGAEEHYAQVLGVLDQVVDARWALFRDAAGMPTTAVIESAQASGLNQVSPSPETARTTHSYGCGQLIQAALEAEATDIVIGLGGSAMTDGGSGALQALGLHIATDEGTSVALGGSNLLSARHLDVSDLDPRLEKTSIHLAVDVSNPLYGPQGAAYIYGPQKGADLAAQRELDMALRHWASLLSLFANDETYIKAGSGAAGGFPSGFLALTSARLKRGFDFVANLCGLEHHLKGADLLIVGEGHMDHQSLHGKAPLAATDMAATFGVPVIAIAGQLSIPNHELIAAGVHAAASLRDTAPSIETAMRDAADHAERATITALEQLNTTTDVV